MYGMKRFMLMLLIVTCWGVYLIGTSPEESPDLKKFVIYNHHGQTLGSFIVDIIQEKGITCVDELFNSRRVVPGIHFSKVFRYKKFIYSKRPDSVKEAFNLLQKCQPFSKKYLGQKICSSQRNKARDFEEILKDKNIVKIFLYRKDEIKFYLTRFFYYKFRVGIGDLKKFPTMSYDPEPFKYYRKLKTKCQGLVIEVECEDFFDFRVNSATTLCQFLGLDDIEVKYLAVKKIERCKIKPLNKILTESELVQMKNYFNMKYSMDQLAKKKVRDCRKVHINLGFL
jgi:hypothetical protein